MNTGTVADEREILAAAARQLWQAGQVEAIRLQRPLVEYDGRTLTALVPMHGGYVPVLGVHPYIDSFFSAIAANDD